MERETGIEPATSRVENLSPSQRNTCLVRLGFNAVAKTTQFSNHLSGPTLRLCTTHSGTTFFITDSLMKKHPDETTQTVCNGSNCLSMAEPRDKPPIKKLKDTALRFDSRMRSLIQETPHLPVAFRREVAVIDTRNFFFYWADAHT